MDKFSFITLWDTYNGLLTATQQEITDMYFNLDLTVSEIAAEKNITRQAVSECLKGCKRQLEEYEEKLHLCKKLRESSLYFSFLLTDAGRWAEKFKIARPELAKDIDELTGILKKDYSDEVKKVLNNPESSEILNKDYTEEVYGRKKTGEETE